MAKRKIPTTIEECNAAMEETQKKIKQYENRNKMLDRKLAIEKRKERNHRLCLQGGYMESITPEIINRTDEEAKVFLCIILNFKKRGKRASENQPVLLWRDKGLIDSSK